MIRLAIASGSFQHANDIAQRLRAPRGAWIYVQSPMVVASLRHTLVVINQDALLEHHPHGDAIHLDLLARAEAGHIVLATVDPTLYPLHDATHPTLPHSD